MTELWSAIIGGLLAGGFSLMTIKITFNGQAEIDRQKAKAEELALLQGLHDELDVIWNWYQKAIGVRFDKLSNGQAFLVYCGISQDYFPVYRGNTDKIGRVQSQELRHQIVSVYTQAMGLIDGFKLNNEFVRKHEYFDTAFQASQKEGDKKIAERYLKSCLEIAPLLKQEHFAFKDNVRKLLEELSPRSRLEHSRDG